MPKVVEFSRDNPLHLQFIQNIANLYSEVYRFQKIFTKEDINQSLETLLKEAKDQFYDINSDKILKIQGKVCFIMIKFHIF